MFEKMNSSWVGAVSALSLFLAAPLALAQDYPSKPIRFVVSSTPGTTVDNLARTLANDMSKTLGQPIVVDNKTGAGQVIGVEAVAKAAPDGYTVGIIGVDGIAMMPLSYKNMRFDPLKDVVPLATIAESRYVLASPLGRPWKTFPEFIAHAKANPGKLNYGSSAAQVRIGVLMIMQRNDLDMVHIPYAAGGTYINSLPAGTIDAGLIGEGIAVSLNARLTILGLSGAKRAASFPDVPTFTELGLPKLYGPSYSMNLPTGVPTAIRDKLNAALEAALRKPDVRSTLNKYALEVNYEGPEAARATLADRAKLYADFAKSANIAPE